MIPRALYALLNYFCSAAVLTFVETFLSDRLIGAFNFSEEKVAFYLFIGTGVYVATSFLLVLIPNSQDKRFIMIPCGLVEGFCLLLIGPSAIL